MSEEEYKYSGRLSLRMPISLHRELAYTAAAQRVSMNQFVCVALAGALGRMSDDPATPESGPRGGPDFDSIMRSMGYDEDD